MSPCYEPPRPDSHDYDEMMRQRDKHIATLKEVEEYCQDALNAAKFGQVAHGRRMAAQDILDIIGSHWRKSPAPTL
jgi:hypothetical protein